MTISRRTVLAALASAPAVAAEPLPTAALAVPASPAGPLYGMIGKMRAKPGQRDALIDLLATGTTGMPGCISYVIAKDALDVDALWITEVWDSAASHKASLALPAVRAAITQGRPMIAGFESHQTQPVAGVNPA